VTRYRFAQNARLEARAAAAWYRERSRDAARDFAEAVATAVNSICENPERWPVWEPETGVRRQLLSGFPYAIFYLVEAGVVVIVAIAHHKQRPGYWSGRLGR
jgi:plasmid stabilization system protein ParE